MEALCFDVGLAGEEVRSIFSDVKAALKKWPRFAQQAGLSAAKIKEIAERHQLIQSRVNI